MTLLQCCFTFFCSFRAAKLDFYLFFWLQENRKGKGKNKYLIFTWKTIRVCKICTTIRLPALKTMLQNSAALAKISDLIHLN